MRHPKQVPLWWPVFLHVGHTMARRPHKKISSISSTCFEDLPLRRPLSDQVRAQHPSRSAREFGPSRAHRRRPAQRSSRRPDEQAWTARIAVAPPTTRTPRDDEHGCSTPDAAAIRPQKRHPTDGRLQLPATDGPSPPTTAQRHRHPLPAKLPPPTAALNFPDEAPDTRRGRPQPQRARRQIASEGASLS